LKESNDPRPQDYYIRNRKEDGRDKGGGEVGCPQNKSEALESQAHKSCTNHAIVPKDETSYQPIVENAPRR
jgi:hypothetical protein